MKLLLTGLITLLIISCAQHSKLKKDSLESISSGEHRSLKNKIRNTYRNPVETLKFFEVKPEHNVVEISPGTGWYSEIIGPYLQAKGKLYLSIYTENSAKSYAARLNKTIKEKTNNKNLYGDVEFTYFEAPGTIGPIAPRESVDRVLTFRNVHNWMKAEKADEAFKAFFTALKPGGILGVVEHRVRGNKKQDPKATSGYVREDYVIGLALKAGFKFVAKSEINANYNDNSNHPKGVWTLPPSMRLKDKNRNKYLAIGESDRMTLKFIKPKN